MFELSNDQRKCFGLNPVNEHWERIEAKPSPYDSFKTSLYLDGDAVVKCIMAGDTQYREWELRETVSSDQKQLLPKTAKGKPVLLSSSNILKRTGVGMRLSYSGENIHLYNENTGCSYFFNSYLNDDVRDMASFSAWVTRWCEETTEKDFADISAFSKEKKKHIRYREGDVFRFKIGRRLYGYGRILLDYDSMRKKKQPFWDILMCKPLVCSAYHIVTEREDVSVKELEGLKSLPSTVVIDNPFYYGEHAVIGNIPIAPNEDYPVMYGNSICAGENAVCYQQGPVFCKKENERQLYAGFINNGVSVDFNLKLDVLTRCMECGTNELYWELYFPYRVEGDLRNPKNAEKLQNIKRQFGL